MPSARHAYWDGQAHSFDDEPDHGLSDPLTRTAWRELLLGVLPAAPARIADLGCGTGTLSALLAEAGYDVVGVDFSPAMLERARVKAPRVQFVLGDAADPAAIGDGFDAVLCRHVLWALPDPGAALARWSALAPHGPIVLIEGRWHTGGGLSGEQTASLLRAVRRDVAVELLTDPVLWGGEIDDERYLAVGLP